MMEQVWSISKRRFERGKGGYGYLTDWFGIWSRNLEVDRKREDGKIRGEIFKMGYGIGKQNARLHGKGGTAKREVEGEDKEASVGV